jgi:hypothetical protein
MIEVTLELYNKRTEEVEALVPSKLIVVPREGEQFSLRGAWYKVTDIRHQLSRDHGHQVIVTLAR